MIRNNKSNKKVKNTQELTNDNNKLDNDLLYNDLIKYFLHLDKKALKQILKSQDNCFLLNEILNEYKDCVENNHCTKTKYHEIPYIEKDVNQKNILVIRREICKKIANIKARNNYKHYFLINDYHNKVFNDFTEALKYILNNKNKQQLSNYLKEIVQKIYDKQSKKFNRLSSFLIEKANEEDFQLFFHEYAISLTNNNYYVSYIDLINFYDAIKNKYLNDEAYIKYANAFSHSDLIILVNIDAFAYDELAWTNLYKLLCEFEKQDKYLVVILPSLLKDIKDVMITSSNNKSASLYGLIQKTLELIKNLIYKNNN